jgi:hypothetical protein
MQTLLKFMQCKEYAHNHDAYCLRSYVNTQPLLLLLLLLAFENPLGAAAAGAAALAHCCHHCRRYCCPHRHEDYCCCQPQQHDCCHLAGIHCCHQLPTQHVSDWAAGRQHPVPVAAAAAEVHLVSLLPLLQGETQQQV